MPRIKIMGGEQLGQYRLDGTTGLYLNPAASKLLYTPYIDPGVLLGCTYDPTRVSPEPTVSGTKHYITPATTIQQVNNMSAVQSGDAVLFQSGGVWYQPNENYALLPKSGVYYGRYGAGAKPVFDALDSSWYVSLGTFRYGQFECRSRSNVTLDGIHFTNGPKGAKGTPEGRVASINVRDCTDIIVRDCISEWTAPGGVYFGSVTGLLVDNVEIRYTGTNSHESITLGDFTNNFIVQNLYVHQNIKAGIDIKNGAHHGIIRNSVFTNIIVDPLIYLSGCNDIEVYNNFLSHKNFASEWEEWTGTVGAEALRGSLSINLEEFSYDHTNTNIDVHDNWIVDGGRHAVGMKLFVTDVSQINLPGPFMVNIHIHNNTIAYSNQTYEWSGIVDVRDQRTTNKNLNDWQNIVIENNLIYNYGIGAANEMEFKDGTDTVCTVRNNMYHTGATGNLGTNPAFTSNPMFADQPNQDYSLLPGSPAEGYGAQDLTGCPLPANSKY